MSPEHPADTVLPFEVLAKLEQLSGDDDSSTLATVYRFAAQCRGLAILVRPTVSTVMAAVAGVSASGAGLARIYVVDTRMPHLKHLFREACKAGCPDEITLYHGSLGDFFRDIPLLPAFICLDGAGDALDFSALSVDLPPRVPIVALNLSAGGAVARALDDAVTLGLLDPPPDHDRSFQWRTTNLCSGAEFEPTVEARRTLQGGLHQRFFGSTTDEAQARTFVSDISEDVRRELAHNAGVRSGYGKWPYVAPETAALPRTLPGGKPWPRISIVTPSFNQGQYIEETILSVLNQGYPNVEYIVVDGGSTDNTPAILDRYRNRVAYAVSEPDRGQSHAINKGMARATGEIVTWLNSDDMLAPGALASVALAFELHDADMIAGICQLYKNGRMVGQHLTSCADGPLPLGEMLDLDNCWNMGQFFYQPEVMFKRDLWLRAGGRVDERLFFSMDYELWLRFAKAGARIHVIGRPVARFRFHAEQKNECQEDLQAAMVGIRDGFLKDNADIDATSSAVCPERRKLRITLLNDHGANFGAGIAHARLARSLAWAGHEVSLVSIAERPGLGAERPVYTTQSVVDRIAASHPDIVLVGNLHGADADPLLLNLLSGRFPTLVVLHDFWVLTGRCGYTGGCGKYLTGCDASCPTPDEYPALPPAEIADAWWKKRLLLTADRRPALLANSAWAAQFAREAFASLSGELTPSIETLRLSFPLDVFRPRDKRSCRETLGLPLDAFIVLLPICLDDPRKGGMPLLEALARLDLPNLLVVTTGSPGTSVGARPPVLQLGYITDPRKVALINSAADVVAVPSAVETFGQVLIEASACGTPPVGYPVAGVDEALRDGVTGLLASHAEPASMAAAIQHLYLHPEVRRDLALWGRIHLENEWSEFAAYHHFFTAFQKLGLLDSLRVQRKIAFLPEAPAVPPIESIWRGGSQWRPRQGFSGKETYAGGSSGPFSYWWAYGPAAFAEMHADTTGRHSILISYRNPYEGQRVEIRCNGPVIGELDLPNTGYDASRMFTVEAELVQGVNSLRFEFSRYRIEAHHPRPLALIVMEILVEKLDYSADACNDLGARQMLEAVWDR
jgi:glycosyltransferase involved in cell wall biosynthesis